MRPRRFGAIKVFNKGIDSGADMESFGGSVKLMLFIYALAATIALIIAWMIKYLFVVIRMQSNRAERRKKAKAASPPMATAATPHRKA